MRAIIIPALLPLLACAPPAGTILGEDVFLGSGVFYTYERDDGDTTRRYLGAAFSDADDTCDAHASLQEAQFMVYRDGSLSFDERNEALGAAWSSAFPVPSWYLTLSVELVDVEPGLGVTIPAAGVVGATLEPDVVHVNLQHLRMPLDAQYFYDYNVQGQAAVEDHLASYIATEGGWAVTLDDDVLAGSLDVTMEAFGGGEGGSLSLPMTLTACARAGEVFAAGG